MKYKIIALIFGIIIFSVTPLFGTAGKKKPESGRNIISVYITQEKTVRNYPLNEYLFGVVGSEMSPDSPAEALKAQAVAARTFLQYKIEQKGANSEYDITDLSASDQQFTPREELMKKWGEKGQNYARKIDDAIKETDSIIVKYNGKIAFTPYHSTSAGKTVAAKSVWGEDFPYLEPVESVGDLFNPDYLSTVTLSFDQFKKTAHEVLKTEKEDAEPITDIITDESGMVLSCKVFGRQVTGREIRSAFSLNSAVFEVKIDDKKNVTFTVRGKGHGVGMSQYGAKVMAQQGSTFDEIIKWYYPGCEV